MRLKKGYYMFKRCTSVICTSILFFCLVSLTSCSNNSSGAATPTPTVDTTPKHYTAHIYYQGSLRPDDLAFDPQGRVLFSDGYHGTVDRINADGSVTVLVKGLGRPEGIIMLADNTLIIAEQKTNRMLAL